MTFQTIQRLASHVPDHLLSKFRMGGESKFTVQGLSGDDPDIVRYVVAFKDMDFGWKFCKICADHQVPLPMIRHRADDVLYRAWLYLVNPTAGRDPVLKQALALTTPEMHSVRTTIKALLLSRGADIQTVAAMAQMDPRVVSMFEKLFFNVLDRKEDILYLQHILFPEGRTVELNEKYLTQETPERLLLRSGRRNGADDVLYWSGASESAMDALALTKSTSQLENMMTGFGLLLAKHGGLNQSGRILPGMSAARQIVAAAQMSGAADDQSMFTRLMGSAIKSEIIQNRRPVRFLEEDIPQVVAVR